VRAAGRDHGGGQLADGLVGGDHAVVGGAVVVLHFLDRDDVGRGQIGDDALGQGLELAVRVDGARWLSCTVPRVVAAMKYPPNCE